MNRTDPVYHPDERALGGRIGDLAESLGELLTGQLRVLMRDHEPDRALLEQCGTCCQPYPCPPIQTARRLLRVEPLAKAAETAEAFAAAVRATGAPILTVLRRPKDDSILHSNWYPPAHEPIELFAFELVYPGDTYRVRISGDGPEQFTQHSPRPAGVGPAYLDGSIRDMPRDWEQTVERISRNVLRQLEFRAAQEAA